MANMIYVLVCSILCWYELVVLYFMRRDNLFFDTENYFDKI